MGGGGLAIELAGGARGRAGETQWLTWIALGIQLGWAGLSWGRLGAELGRAKG